MRTSKIHVLTLYYSVHVDRVIVHIVLLNIDNLLKTILSQTDYFM